MSLQAGDLRAVIDIEAPGGTRSASGAVTGATWALFATVRARIQTVGGAEIAMGLEILAMTTHIITIRYVPGVENTMRINFKTDAQRLANLDGRLFEILKTNDLEERHHEIQLECKEATRGHGL